MSDELDQLRARVAALEQLVLDQARGPAMDAPNAPQRFIVMARRTGVQWQERGVSGGALVDMTQGRKVVNDAGAGAIIATTDEVFLMELEDEVGRRYVQIGGLTVRFGVLVSTTGNGVVLTPCKGYGDVTPTGEPNIPCFITWPITVAVDAGDIYELNIGEIYAYLPIGLSGTGDPITRGTLLPVRIRTGC